MRGGREQAAKIFPKEWGNLVGRVAMELSVGKYGRAEWWLLLEAGDAEEGTFGGANGEMVSRRLQAVAQDPAPLELSQDADE